MNTRSIKTNSTGFTLIELLVVIAIIPQLHQQILASSAAAMGSRIGAGLLPCKRVNGDGGRLNA
jgi:prepilin-type N-terminal cleavage/methylation domain-containing protein